MPYQMYNPYQQNFYNPAMPDQLAQFRQQYQQPTQQATQQSSGVIWVQGEEGAKAYMVAPGNSVMLLDSEASAFYLKSTDQSGMPLPLRIFDYKERQTAPKSQPVAQPTTEYVTRAEFEAAISALKEDNDAKPAV